MASRERFSIDAALAELDVATAMPLRQKLTSLAECFHGATQGTLTMRDDSRLAYLFCTSSLGSEWTREEVMHEMMCIQQITQATSYGAVSQDAVRILATQLHADTKASWTAVWKTVSTLGCDAVKYACMDAKGMRLDRLLQLEDWSASPPGLSPPPTHSASQGTGGVSGEESR